MDLSTHQKELEQLAKLGFTVNPLNQVCYSLEEAWKVQENLQKEKESLNYPIDGLVVKLNDNKLTEELGVVGKTNRAWCAIKFPAKETVTKILGVTWQVGRTGKVTPVAELEPVNLEGTIVKRATLHNFQEFCDKNLRKFDQLTIRKAGDIIPEVVKVLSELRLEENKNLNFEIPKKCPSCQTELNKTSTGIDLVCKNTQKCPQQILLRLSYFSSRKIANINGLSQKNLQKFIELFGIEDIYDLYKLPYEKIFELEGFGHKSVENLKKSIQEAKQVEADKFLAGLSIEGVGKEVAKLILDKMLAKEKEGF